MYTGNRKSFTLVSRTDLKGDGGAWNETYLGLYTQCSLKRTEMLQLYR